MLLAFGLAIGGLGLLRLLAGVQVETHWTGQPMFSYGLVAGGGLCAILSLIPTSWVTWAAQSTRLKPKQRHD